MIAKISPPLVVVLFVTLTVTERLAAQTVDGNPLPLNASQYKINRLAPGVQTDQSVFHIDQCNTVIVDIVANVGDISTSIIGPSGQVINPNTVTALGGTFQTFNGAQQKGFLILPTLMPGFHYIYRFPLLGIGDYTVRFQANSNPGGEVPILTQLTTDSKIAASLFPTEPVITVGSPTVLSAAVFNDKSPVTGATIAVAVKPPSGAMVNLSLLDNGGTSDGVAGDGIYSGEFTPSVAGAYTAVAQITGTAGGVSFSRQAMTAFRVVPQTATLTGLITDRGVDDNSNGLFDRIVISAGVNASQAGKHHLVLRLKTKNGATIVRTAEKTLTSGMQTFDVSFESAAITATGENGPYTVDAVELDSIDTTNGEAPSDRRFNTGSTQAYQLSQFEQATMSFVGVQSSQGFDTNSNGLFDKLVVQVQVKVAVSGSYSWSLKLDDQSRGEIDFTSGSGQLSSGINTIPMEFKGAQIGASGIDGPYLLRDLLLFSSAASLVQNDAGQTPAFKANQFESFNPNAANIAISQTAAPNPVAPGANITYNITVTNNGPRNAPSLSVADNLPSTVGFVSCLATGGGVCAGSGNNRTVSFVPLAAGTSASITIVAKVNNGIAQSNVANTVSVTSTASDPNLSDNSATATVQTTKSIQLASPTFNVNEGAGGVTISVTRTGDVSGTATVDYKTTDNDTFTDACTKKQGQAYGRCDFATVQGTLSFAAGETAKSFVVPIIDDAFAEEGETFGVALTNATGSPLGGQSIATVIIDDNDATDQPNPILMTNTTGIAFVVRQNYLDFLGRDPEPGEPWSNILRNCADQFNTNPNSPSAACDRINVSGSFFGSPEYKTKGFYVIDMYRVAFNRLPTYVEFSNDLASVTGTTAQETFARRAAYANNFIQRSEFSQFYGAMSNTDFVNALMGGLKGQNYNLTSIRTPNPVTPDDAADANKVTLTRNDLINGLNGATLTKAQVLRAIVQSNEISLQKEAVNAFVASQYYGYLRRTPDQVGFNSWINHLTANPSDFRTMINGFMNSTEYRLRFGPAQ